MINPKAWITTHLREVPLILIYYSVRNYLDNYEKWIEYGFKEMWYFSERGLVHCNRPVKEWEEMLTKISQLEEGRIEGLITEMERADQEVKFFLEKNKVINENKKLELFSQYDKLIYNYFGIFTLILHLGSALPPEKLAKYRDRLTPLKSITMYEILEKEFLNPFFEIIAKKEKWEKKYLFYCHPKEIFSYLQKGKKIDVEEGRKRYEIYSLYIDKEKEILLSGEEAREFIKRMNLIKYEVSPTNEVKGEIGCKGKTKGKVKIILREEDFSKIEEGDILISPMTTVKYVPVMKKAVAIVTDEGGVTCHAAILSREMKKPCIIGTKIATKIFKDGDWVEVDAEEGIVRKI